MAEPFGQPHNQGGMELEKLERILDDLRFQPAWRREADRDADFYDGNQLEGTTLQLMKERGIPPIIINLIKPTIDTVLGLEAKSRTDWMVRAETDDEKDMADALAVKLKREARVTRANRATADAYASQLKTGMGWVEVSRENDPFAPSKYRVKPVHRNSIWWDWRAKDPLLRDARYLVRQAWYDVDDAKAMFPGHAKMVDMAINGYPHWIVEQYGEDTGLMREWNASQETRIPSDEWLDSLRQRVAIYEVWYRVFVRGHILRLPNGRVIEYDHRDPRHRQAVASGRITPERARFTKVRLAWWMGPHRLYDEPNPYPFNAFPYVPFVGYREDRTGVPYGMVRAMRHPQEEVNARRAKMMWLLSANRVIADADAVKDGDHARVSREISRPDAYVILDENRKNANGFQIDEGAQMSSQQFQVFQESKQNIQDASGMFHEALGSGAGAGQSGAAISALVEQSVTTLGEVNDNYKDGRQMTGQMLLDLIVEDLRDQSNVTVQVPKEDGGPKTVRLNEPSSDAIGNAIRNNDVAKTRAGVELEEVPNTTTYRQEYMRELTGLVQGLPPEIQAPLIDIVMESAPIPGAKELAERVRKVTGAGQGPDPMQQKQQQLELERQIEELRNMRAKSEAEAAKAKKTLAETQKLSGVDTEKTEAETIHTRAETRKTMVDAAATAQESERQDIQTLESIEDNERRRFQEDNNDQSEQAEEVEAD